MFVAFRHVVLSLLPVVAGLSAGWGFAYFQGSCGAAVGFLFAAKCRGVQLEYQLLFQMFGTASGAVLAALLGTWLEHRRNRVGQSDASIPGATS